MKNKKSQIGAILTWFIAFVIIFFIMMIFISATLLISARKKLTVGSHDINIGSQTSDLDAQKTLINLLNSKIGEIKFRDYILENKDYEAARNKYLNEEPDDVLINHLSDFHAKTNFNSQISLRNYKDGKQSFSYVPFGRDIKDKGILECRFNIVRMKFFNVDDTGKRISVTEVLICHGSWRTHEEDKKFIEEWNNPYNTINPNRFGGGGWNLP